MGMGRGLVLGVVAAVVLFACGTEQDAPGEVTPPTEEQPGGGGGGGAGGGDERPNVDAGTTVVIEEPDAGVVEPEPDAGVVEPEPDAGVVPEPDAGTVEPDAGTVNPAGPWPNVPVMNYSTSFSIGAVQSVGVDDGQNIWLLSGNRIGVLRPGTTTPVWVSSIGQAAPGWGVLANNSTVICGGEKGRAYVGYATTELDNACSKVDPNNPYVCQGDVNNPEYKKGDVDVVKLNTAGGIELETHLSKSVTYLGAIQNTLGIRNTNNWTYDEDRSVFTCGRIPVGPNKNDVFIGTNHGVTMIRGTTYNSHRHPSWYKQICNVGSDGVERCSNRLMSGYSYGLGFSHDWADVLIANEWTIGISQAPADLALWDRFPELPWKFNGHNQALNSLDEFDYWRGMAQVKSGEYYLSSDRYGLWKMVRNSVSDAGFAKISGLPTDALTQVWGTQDGSLFIGTQGHGLWRLSADNTLAAVSGVPGSTVKQLVYDPSVTPASLYVLTNAGLTVLRGY